MQIKDKVGVVAGISLCVNLLADTEQSKLAGQIHTEKPTFLKVDSTVINLPDFGIVGDRLVAPSCSNYQVRDPGPIHPRCLSASFSEVVIHTGLWK